DKVAFNDDGLIREHAAGARVEEVAGLDECSGLGGWRLRPGNGCTQQQQARNRDEAEFVTHGFSVPLPTRFGAARLERWTAWMQPSCAARQNLFVGACRGEDGSKVRYDRMLPE